nr:hypothetical protein [Tanacetum cinerariifolium]
MLLLVVRNQLINPLRDDVSDFAIALRMFTRSLVIQKRVKDFQLEVESYQKQINRNRLMCSDELYKFNDGTVTRFLSSLEDITKNIDMEYLPKRRWSILEKKRDHCMIKDINKLPKKRWMMRSLEKFNDKSEVVYAMCKQCLITTNHDVCVLNYVNGMNSCDDNQSANVLNSENHKKDKPKVKNSKKLGSKERLALPRPRKPKACLRWSPTGRIFDHCGKIIESSDSEKPDISILHVFEALCYPKNDREDIGKLGAKDATRTDPAAPVTQNLQTLNASTTIIESAPTPTNSSTETPTASNTSQNIDELQQQSPHDSQQQDNQAQL